MREKRRILQRKDGKEKGSFRRFRRFRLNVTGKGVGGTWSIIFLDVFVVHKFHLDLL